MYTCTDCALLVFCAMNELIIVICILANIVAITRGREYPQIELEQDIFYETAGTSKGYDKTTQWIQRSEERNRIISTTNSKRGISLYAHAVFDFAHDATKLFS